ncbi:hypothetical protein CTZ28_11685 [Streptomyces shenzhenensis]|uniref:Uncharacterized protein n=1 Tax=Streptomyces shenzhenensis TaxID=943815 RepID=A0A3M0I9C7_9ACTN|nr:hypothetical protein CTZ28_11685 [Streptomyces shenzhenensis]
MRSAVGAAGRVCSGSSSARPMLRLSGASAACGLAPEWRSSEARVRPPPTSATAVATTARRWFFFHRARCRRRAARPSPVGSGLARSSAAGVASVASGPDPGPSGAAGSCQVSHAVAGRAAGVSAARAGRAGATAVAAVPCAVRSGAMSGA